MNVATINMSKLAARRKWGEYRKAVNHAQGTPEDEALRKAYRFLSQGRQVLSLHQVMSDAGRDDNWCPKIAAARPTWDHVHFLFDGMVPLLSCSNDFRRSWERGNWRYQYKFRTETFGPPAPPEVRRNLCARAVVPKIPIDLRPRKRLERYTILFEAAWQNVTRDPILLSSLGSDLYLVLAQWDLTELERAILFQKV